jgi:hypothetical protein
MSPAFIRYVLDKITDLQGCLESHTMQDYPPHHLGMQYPAPINYVSLEYRSDPVSSCFDWTMPLKILPEHSGTLQPEGCYYVF